MPNKDHPYWPITPFLKLPFLLCLWGNMWLPTSVGGTVSWGHSGQISNAWYIIRIFSQQIFLTQNCFWLPFFLAQNFCENFYLFRPTFFPVAHNLSLVVPEDYCWASGVSDVVCKVGVWTTSFGLVISLDSKFSTNMNC